MKKLIFLLLITNHSLLTAQTQFQRTVGGTFGEYAYSIIRTTDGGYAAAGWTYSFGAGGNDMYIIKLNASGTLQWSRTIGGPNQDYAYSIIQTTDGGYAAAGYTNSFGAGNYDVYIVKLNASGTLQWSRTIGGTNQDYSLSIIRTTDGGYAVGGFTNSFGAGNGDMYIVKLDGSGTLQWTRTTGGTNSDYAYSIIQTTDGGYAAAGYTLSYGAGGSDIYVVKLDGSGTLQWSRTIGGTQGDYAYSIIQTTDGGYAASGWTYSFVAGNGDMYIVKLNASGTLQWSRTIGGTSYDFAYSIIQTTDGGYAAAGGTYSFGAGGEDMYIVKLDGSGTFQWSRTIGGTSNEEALSIIRTTDGGYAAAGYANSFGAGGYKMYIVKLDASGNTCGNSTSPPSQSGSGGTTTSPTSTVTTPASTVTTPSPITSTGGTVTTICLVGIQPNSNQIPSSFGLEQNYPNPFNASSKFKIQISKLSDVKVTLYDAAGREIKVLVNEYLEPGIYEVTVDAAVLASGLYFYRMIAGSFNETKKMILMK